MTFKDLELELRTIEKRQDYKVFRDTGLGVGFLTVLSSVVTAPKHMLWGFSVLDVIGCTSIFCLIMALLIQRSLRTLAKTTESE